MQWTLTFTDPPPPILPHCTCNVILFLCNLNFFVWCVYTPFPSVHCVIIVILCNSFIQSQTSYQCNDHFNKLLLPIDLFLCTSIFFSIFILFILLSWLKYLNCTSLRIFIFSFFLSMYLAPYTKALQFRCILCSMTIKYSNNSINKHM